MALDELRASINALLDQIERNPHASHRLQADLRDRIAEVEALGTAMPCQVTARAAAFEDDVEDLFDNCPV